jgi:hypothetical protein
VSGRVNGFGPAHDWVNDRLTCPYCGGPVDDGRHPLRKLECGVVTRECQASTKAPVEPS